MTHSPRSPDYSDLIVQQAFLALPGEDQEALRWTHYEKSQPKSTDIQAGIQTQASKTLEISEEILSFGLTPGEKQSIESDIVSQKPIGVGQSTPAYQKFLNAALKREVSLSPCLESHPDALSIIEALKLLFPDKRNSLRLANTSEAHKSLKENNHLTGYRLAGSRKIKDPDLVGYAWIDGEMQNGLAPYISRNHLSYLVDNWLNPQFCQSVIPVFG